MVILSKEDLYQVKFASLIADYDRKSIIDLYMPIMGYAAVCIYFSFWTEADKDRFDLYQTHETLLVKMQMSTGTFLDERKKLEALGLLKTNIKKENGYNIYTYEIYAPKTPESFFSNTLLYGTLIKYVGESYANKLRCYYAVRTSNDLGDDISTSFASVYNPDLTSPLYKKAFSVKKGEMLDRLQSKVDSEFNFDLFIETVKGSSQINSAVFTKKVLKEISRLAALYGIGEETAAICFIECYCPDNPAGEKIDFKLLSQKFMDEIKYPFLAKKKDNIDDIARISSDTNLGRKINWMETVSCKEFLQIKQNNTKPVTADLKLVDDISSKLGLRPAVINAILDYSLAKNNNVLSRNYVEKVAASVAREKLETAYDTMIFLNKKRVFKQLKANKVYENDRLEDTTDIRIKNSLENQKKNLIDDDFDENEWKKMIDEVGGN